MSFVTDILGAVIGSNAASNAANTESQAAQQAEGLEAKNQQDANQAENNVWSGTQAAEQPYQQTGATGANALNRYVSNGFTAPTLAQAEATPGYQFNLQQGTQAIADQASATGNLLSGTTGTALEQYGQGLAQTTYQQAFNNALNTYGTNYQSALGASQLGLNSTGQLGQFGQEYGSTNANIDLTSAQQQAQQINNAAAARASGYLQSAAQWQNALGGASGSVGGGLGNVDFSGGSSPLEMAGEFAAGA
jgi:hypothetical protein